MEKPLTTKAAFSKWNERIAPVFDVARQLHIVEVESGKVVREILQELAEEEPAKRALLLSNLDIGTLVCGAISRPMRDMISMRRICIIPFVAGELRKVIQAWLEGRLDAGVFAMPGCLGLGRRRNRDLNLNEEDKIVNGTKGGGSGAGRGRGRDQGRRGMGRMGGPLAAGPQGYCVCPQCGHRESHLLGIKCAQKQCPACGIAMTRK